MAKLITIRTTRAEAFQLLAYVRARDRSGLDAGWYYGPHKDFQRRHESLLEILERATTFDSATTQEAKP